MKKAIILFSLIFSFFYLQAQTEAQLDSIARVAKIDTSKIEIESEFPGGVKGWNNFLSSTLVYPQKAIRKNIQGQVVARFIIDKDGSISDIAIISGPKELAVIWALA